MKTEEQIKDLAYYESLPYTVTIRKDDEGDFIARVQELPGCIAHGSTQAIALDNLDSMKRLWIEDALTAGDPIPEAEQEPVHSGKWVQRVPRRLHRDLSQMASRERVSLNQLVTSLLAEAVTARSCMHAISEFLTHVPPRVPEQRHIGIYWGWSEPSEPTEWAVAPTIRGNITRQIAAVQKISAVHRPITKDTYGWVTDEHTGSQKQLARK